MEMCLLDLQNYCKIWIHRQILLEVTSLLPGDYPVSIMNGEKKASLVIHLILQDVWDICPVLTNYRAGQDWMTIVEQAVGKIKCKMKQTQKTKAISKCFTGLGLNLIVSKINTDFIRKRFIPLTIVKQYDILIAPHSKCEICDQLNANIDKDLIKIRVWITL